MYRKEELPVNFSAHLLNAIAHCYIYAKYLCKKRELTSQRFAIAVHNRTNNAIAYQY
jgi:hypothetical protein